jgi:signal transduction histidine kinase
MRRYLVAVGVVVIALVLTYVSRTALEPTPFLLFLIAAPVAAWYGGLGPGVLAMALSLAIVFLAFPDASDVIAQEDARGRRLVIFLTATVLLGWQSSAHRRARAALRLLADAGALLGASLDYASRLTAAARVAVADYADGCIIDSLDESGTLCCASAAHTDPDREKQLRLAAEQQPPSISAPRGLAEVLRSGQPLACSRLTEALLAELVPEEPRRQALQDLGIRSLLIVPLCARGRRLGTMTLLSSRWLRRFRRADLALAADLAQRAAMAIDNARLYREAREMEEALRSRAEQLAAANREKDEFLAVVAHELRGPLAALRGSLEVLRVYQPEASPAEASQGIMARQLDALARLVDDLLDVTRITQGKAGLRRQPVDLNDVLQAAEVTCRPLLDARGHSLTMTLARDGCPIDGDPHRLEQVFVNLLTNAAKYTDPGGHIWLSAAREAEAGVAPQALVSVRDTGIGMSAEFLPHAFDLFAQGPEAPGRSQGGLGIGLALVRRLVEMHGGSVAAHSDGPGRGSEFVVRLPLLTLEGGGWREERPGPLPRRKPRAPLDILVVDDNIDAAETLALLLRMHGHQVRVASDGPRALALVRERPADVVLLDLGLPGMDGHEVGRRLRREVGLDKALVVALTGSSAEDDRRRSREAGFDHHLVKPVDPEELDRLLASQ